MKQLVIVGVVVACAWGGTSSAQQKSPVFAFPYETMELSNGLRAYFIKAATPGQFAFISYVRTGSRDEVDPGKSGFAHFFEHVMFSGTAKYPDYDGETSRMGAFRNASTGPDSTQYYVVANSAYLEKVIDIESDRFQNLTYDEPTFRTEAGAVLGEHQQGALDPQRWLNENLRAAVFAVHPYRHSTIGLEADVRAMPGGYGYSKRFFERFYRPDNVVLVVAGDFDVGRARALVTTHYGGWKRGYEAPAIVPEPPQTAARAATVRYPGRTLPVLAVSYRAPAWDPVDRSAAALTVLGQVAFGPNSALFRKLVLRERRVQSLRPAFGLSRDPYIVTIQATVSDPAQTKAIESEILTTVTSFQNTLIETKQLADAKANLRYGFLMGLEAALDVAFATRQSITSTGRLEPLEQYYATLDAVTADDVRDAARRHLVESGRTIVTMIQEN